MRRTSMPPSSYYAFVNALFWGCHETSTVPDPVSRVRAKRIHNLALNLALVPSLELTEAEVDFDPPEN
jgi:hypothetical protein